MNVQCVCLCVYTFKFVPFMFNARLIVAVIFDILPNANIRKQLACPK